MWYVKNGCVFVCVFKCVCVAIMFFLQDICGAKRKKTVYYIEHEKHPCT